jgi:hypothetical protein
MGSIWRKQILDTLESIGFSNRFSHGIPRLHACVLVLSESHPPGANPVHRREYRFAIILNLLDPMILNL